MKEKLLNISSKTVSLLCSPFLTAPLVFIAIFLYSPYGILPMGFKVYMIYSVLFFTLLSPALAISTYMLLAKKKISSLSERKSRNIPYALTLLSYYFGYLHMSRYVVYYDPVLLVYKVAMAAMVVCALVNVKWKISAHMTSMGALTSAVVWYGLLQDVSVVLPLSLLILLSGIVGTARMILKEHTYVQLLAGFLNGYICVYLIIY